MFNSSYLLQQFEIKVDYTKSITSFRYTEIGLFHTRTPQLVTTKKSALVNLQTVYDAFA